TKMFSVILTFSTKNTGETETMMNDESQRSMFGFDKATVAGRDALTAKQRGAGRADFTVVVSNSRMVSIAPASDDLPDLAMIKQVFEKIDFDGIANK
ncbi:MAG TPA: hypothetical protein VN807_05235, partial [Candidatus Sulfotelmatobacter sp.]|nr:hypothetical protein [Candidatus Sulfotelmatobacter sp.]